MMRVACLLVGQDYEIGSMPPSGYLQWHEWAGIQHKSGLRQQQCGRCGKWYFPQELSSEVDKGQARLGRKNGPVVTIATPVCLMCSESHGVIEGRA